MNDGRGPGGGFPGFGINFSGSGMLTPREIFDMTTLLTKAINDLRGTMGVELPALRAEIARMNVNMAGYEGRIDTVSKRLEVLHLDVERVATTMEENAKIMKALGGN